MEKFYEWECPYCNIDAKGTHKYLTSQPYEHGCSGCGKYYRVGIDNSKLYVTANMEILVKYLIGLALQRYKREENISGLELGTKFIQCKEYLRQMLQERYGYIGSITGLLRLDVL